MTDCCVVETALGGFADRIGIRGTTGFVVLRVCLEAAPEYCNEVAAVVGAGGCTASISEGGCEVDGVSTSASDGTAMVDA